MNGSKLAQSISDYRNVDIFDGWTVKRLIGRASLIPVLVGLILLAPMSPAHAAADKCTELLSKPISVSKTIRRLQKETSLWGAAPTPEQVEKLKLGIRELLPFARRGTVNTIDPIYKSEETEIFYGLVSLYLESQGITNWLDRDYSSKSGSYHIRIRIVPDLKSDLGKFAMKMQRRGSVTFLSLPMVTYFGSELYPSDKLGYYDGNIFQQEFELTDGVSPKSKHISKRTYLPIEMALGDANPKFTKSQVLKHLTDLFESYNQPPPTIGIEFEGLGQAQDMKGFEKFVSDLSDLMENKIGRNRLATTYVDQIPSLELQGDSKLSRRVWAVSPEKLEASGPPGPYYLQGLEVRTPVLRGLPGLKEADEKEVETMLQIIAENKLDFYPYPYGGALQIHLGIGKITTAEMALIYYAFDILDPSLRDFFQVSPTRLNYTLPVLPEMVHAIELAYINKSSNFGLMTYFNLLYYGAGKTFIRYKPNYNTFEFGLPNSTLSYAEVMKTIRFYRSFVMALRTKNKKVLSFLGQIKPNGDRTVIEQLIILMEREQILYGK